MNHYDVLGLERSATQEDVRRAFRRESMRTHPDRGGSQAAQTAVNRAYEVLMDTDLRAHYDSTGEDVRPKPEDIVARDLFLSFIAQILEVIEGQEPVNVDHIDPKDMMKHLIKSSLEESVKVKDDLVTRRIRLVRIKGQMQRSVKGPNLWEQALDARIAMMDDKIASFPVHARALKDVEMLASEYFRAGLGLSIAGLVGGFNKVFGGSSV